MLKSASTYRARVRPEFAFGSPSIRLRLRQARTRVGRRAAAGAQYVGLRNHLRLWLAPFIVDGLQVWLGQISRDIGKTY